MLLFCGISHTNYSLCRSISTFCHANNSKFQNCPNELLVIVIITIFKREQIITNIPAIQGRVNGFDVLLAAVFAQFKIFFKFSV